MSCAAQSEIGPDQGALPYNALMSEKNILTLRRADQARTDFALIEDHLEFIAGQLVRVPTRADLARAVSVSSSVILLRRSVLASRSSRLLS